MYFKYIKKNLLNVLYIGKGFIKPFHSMEVILTSTKYLLNRVSYYSYNNNTHDFWDPIKDQNIQRKKCDNMQSNT